MLIAKWILLVLFVLKIINLMFQRGTKLEVEFNDTEIAGRLIFFAIIGVLYYYAGIFSIILK